MNNFKIDSLITECNEKTYITFEIGPTHHGIESAKRLIKYSANAGANAVKFQTFDLDKLISDKKQLFSYEILVNKLTGEKKKVEEPLYNILKGRCFTPAEWNEIKTFCDSCGVEFISTVGFEEDIKLLEEIGCDSIKIASADVNHFPLLRCAAQTGMVIQLDTGMSTIDEIKKAIAVIESEGNNKIIIHHCPSGYPAYIDSINLNIIPILKKELGYPIAFSDHSPGWDMDIAAVSLGVNLIEKTITEDREFPDVEHMMSIEPSEMNEFVKVIRNLEKALGSGIREMSLDEKNKRDAVRRSVFTSEDIKKGTALSDVKVEFKRPGNYIQPDEYEKLIGERKILVNNIQKGSPIKMTDLE